MSCLLLVGRARRRSDSTLLIPMAKDELDWCVLFPSHSDCFGPTVYNGKNWRLGSCNGWLLAGKHGFLVGENMLGFGICSRILLEDGQGSNFQVHPQPMGMHDAAFRALQKPTLFG